MATSMYPQQDGAVPQKQGGGAIAGGKKPPTGDGKSRTALVNISNRVTGANKTKENNPPQPPVPQISRPMTRSFRAKLLAEQQTKKNPLVLPTAPKPNKQVPNKQVPNVLKPNKQVPNVLKPNKQVPTVPKPNKQVPTAPKLDAPEQKTQRQREERGSKKKVHSLTSVLSARSWEASRLPVTDIDRNDANNQLAMVEYVEDIYLYYRLSEKETRPSPDYMEAQTEINPRMRSILIDWLIEVHSKFELTMEALYLTIFLVDKYISTLSADPLSSPVRRQEMQLVGISSMLIACKYEEIWAPEVNDFIAISDRAYSREQILGMEKDILEKIEWNVTVPTAFVFLNRFLKAAAADKETERMAFFLAELGMVHYEILKYVPSMVSAAAVYAARCTLKKENNDCWDQTLTEHTGFEEREVVECARLLVLFHSSMMQSKLKAVFNKYSSPRLHSVALLPAATAEAFFQRTDFL